MSVPAEESAPIRLARQAIEEYVRNGRQIPVPEDVPESLTQARAGAFVCVKKEGQLRGCIGTTQPTEPSLADEIIRNAIQCSTRDPRFPPVSAAELGQLKYSVDVLEPPEPVSGLDELDPSRYGVIVQSGWRSGLLLPDLEGVATAEQQVDIARRKAGIDAGEPVRLYRFTVTRYE